MKKIFGAVAVFLSLVVLSGCSATDPSSWFGSSSAPKPNRTCVDIVINSFENEQSMGMWECATQNLRASWFNKNTVVLDNKSGKSESWNSDADITVWLKSLAQYYSQVSVQEFSNDPLPAYNTNGGTQVGYYYLITVWGQFPDGSWETSGASFIIEVNYQGQLIDIQ